MQLELKRRMERARESASKSARTQSLSAVFSGRHWFILWKKIFKIISAS